MKSITERNIEKLRSWFPSGPEGLTAEFIYTTSRGADTYGYNICTLYVRGLKVASTCGGGYDMSGAALGEFIERYWQAELLGIKARAASVWDGTRRESMPDRPGALYGMTYHAHKDKISLDGACGFSSMEAVLKALGYVLRFNGEQRRNRTLYTIMKAEA